MKFDITVINVQATTKPTKKGSYIMLDVAYKNNNTGKIEGKKVMSFVNKDLFDVLSKASNGATYTITSEKNEESGYWDWVGIATAAGDDPTNAIPTGTPAGKSFASPKSTYETAEERAARQVLIVRQSSLTAAIATVKTDKKEVDAQQVMAVAQLYCDWVFQKNTDMPDFTDMADDIPS